jgi:predicted DNA-binding WGR domain protein
MSPWHHYARAVMTKLYSDEGSGAPRYHEAWVDGSTVVEHWGVIGERGDSRDHPVPDGSDPAEVLAAVLADARARGFEELDEDSLTFVEVQYDLDTWGSGADHDTRIRVEDFLNEELGWTGLGHLDGGSIGSGTMEVCVAVVDVPIATRVITAALDGTDLPAPARFLVEGEPIEQG